MLIRRWMVALTPLLLAGCVHRTNVPLRPNYTTEIKPGQALGSVAPGLTFFRGDYADKRPDPTKLSTFKQGVHTYNLMEERPMANALYEGLAAQLSASKQKWNDTIPGDVKVNITFLNMNAARNAGFVKVGASATIQIKVDFLNAKTSNVIYSNVYTGRDERDKSMIGGMGMVISSIDSAILRCIQSIGDDAGLASALTKSR